jgi:hypothetical protein
VAPRGCWWLLPPPRGWEPGRGDFCGAPGDVGSRVGDEEIGW